MFTYPAYPAPSLKLGAYRTKDSLEKLAKELAMEDLLPEKLKGHCAILWSTPAGREAIKKYQENHPDYKQLSDLSLSLNLDRLNELRISNELKEIIAYDYSVMFAYHAKGPVLVRSVDQAGAFSFSRQAENHAILINPNITMIQEIHLDSNGCLVVTEPQDKWAAHYQMKERWVQNAINKIEQSSPETYPTARMELLQCLANIYNVINSSDNTPPPPTTFGLTEAFQSSNTHGPFTAREITPLQNNDRLMAVLSRYPDMITSLSSAEYEILGITPENQDMFPDDMTQLIFNGTMWNPVERQHSAAAIFKSDDCPVPPPIIADSIFPPEHITCAHN